MFHQTNKNYYSDDYDYSSLYSRTSYSFNNKFFDDDNSIFTRNEYDDGHVHEDHDAVGDIIDSYIDKYELIDVKPIEFENDNIYIIKGHPRDEKYFSLPLTQDQYYTLKERWNKQLDDEIDRIRGARVINHLSITSSENSENENSVLSINSCPELTNSDISNHLQSQFFDSDDEKDSKKINWRKWFQKKRKTNDKNKVKTNFYESLIKKSN